MGPLQTVGMVSVAESSATKAPSKLIGVKINQVSAGLYSPELVIFMLQIGWQNLDWSVTSFLPGLMKLSFIPALHGFVRLQVSKKARTY